MVEVEEDDLVWMADHPGSGLVENLLEVGGLEPVAGPQGPVVGAADAEVEVADAVVQLVLGVLGRSLRRRVAGTDGVRDEAPDVRGLTVPRDRAVAVDPVRAHVMRARDGELVERRVGDLAAEVTHPLGPPDELRGPGDGRSR